jgi:hypothetical protein
VLIGGVGLAGAAPVLGSVAAAEIRSGA